MSKINKILLVIILGGSFSISQVSFGSWGGIIDNATREDIKNYNSNKKNSSNEDSEIVKNDWINTSESSKWGWISFTIDAKTWKQKIYPELTQEQALGAIDSKITEANTAVTDLKNAWFWDHSIEMQGAAWAVNSLTGLKEDVQSWTIITEKTIKEAATDINNVPTVIKKRKTTEDTLSNQTEALTTTREKLLKNWYSEDSPEIKEIDTALWNIKDTQDSLKDWAWLAWTDKTIKEAGGTIEVANIQNSSSKAIAKNKKKISDLETQESKIKDDIKSKKITKKEGEKKLEWIAKEKTELEQANKDIQALAKKQTELAREKAKDNPNPDRIAELENEINWINKDVQKFNDSQFKKDCWKSWNCLTETSFMLDTTSIFWPWKSKKNWNWDANWWTSKRAINGLLGTIIQKLMIALGTISLLIMSIWAGYIILYHGQDEYLSKWKWIFVAGLTSLVVALSSYLLVNLVRFILYSTTWGS